MKRKENSAHSSPPLNRPRGKRKALAELPKSNRLNMNHDLAPRPSKPRTRSGERAKAEAEAAMKRRKAGDAARWQMDTRQPDAEAAVALYVRDIHRCLWSLEVRISPFPQFHCDWEHARERI
jgi:cyclin-A